MSDTSWDSIDKLLQELIQLQHKTLLNCGRQIIPNLTTDDILQPNDYNNLEHNPVFRYEEGILAGFQSVQMALRALKNEVNYEQIQSDLHCDCGTFKD